MPATIINGRYALSPNPKIGGMADVYSAYDTEQSTRVAVKLFRDGTFNQAILAESFNRETRALQELKHPGIVEILGAGRDEATGRYFIVLEWIERNLSEWLETSSLAGWDQFYQDIGKDILEALAFAHTRHFVHRDLKTKNILISKDDHPKLADFGIAKLKRFTEPGLTLADFVSRPFTPPEYDDGSYSYTRDVYGFGVIALNCLTGIPLKEYEDVAKALEEFDATDEVIEVIAQAVSLDPSKRQRHAGILLTELEKIWQLRSPHWVTRRNCYLKLSRSALKTLKEALNTEREQDIQNIVIEDLKAVCGIKSLEATPDEGAPPGTVQEVQFNIFGERFRYHVAVDERGGDHLFVISVRSPSSALLERLREASWQAPYKFKFGMPPDPAEAKDVIQELQLKVDEYEAQLRSDLRAKADEQFFHVWETILRAKTEIEKSRNVPLRYNGVAVNGNRAVLQLLEFPDEDVTGQARLIRLQNGGIVSGEVEVIRGRELHLYVLYGEPGQIPRAGRIEFDTRAADAALERQKSALDSVRFDRAVRPGLKNLIAHPEKARLPESIGEISFANTSIDEAKQAAVYAALGTNDFLIVEGPPGTGKTTFIAELVVQTLRQNPHTRILLTSQTHVALDNAIERIRNLSPELKIVRVAGKAGSARVAPEAQPFLLGNQMARWREEVLDSGRKFIVKCAASNGIAPDDVKFGMLLKEFVSTRRDLSNKEKDLAELEGELYQATGEEVKAGHLPAALSDESEQVLDLKNDIARINSEIKATKKNLQQIEKSLTGLSEIGKELVAQPDDELDEWVSAYLPDTPATKRLLELLSIFSDWETQFGRREEYEVALLASAQLIAGTCLGVTGIKGAQEIEYDLCIVDESSKATPTEVLIPISRSRRWVLVGDQRQLSPFQDPALKTHEMLERYDLRRDELKTTLFDHLIDRLPNACKTALTIQHRMVRPIGNLVSECFYDGNLQTASKSLDTNLSLVFPRPVTWFTTAGLPDRSEKAVEASYVNNCEVRFLHQLLKRINWAAGLSKVRYKVALITGYSGQKKELERTIARDVNSWEHINVECNTVDAFQGREADIALYSVTRSNNAGNIGFLYERERINVALSRGRYFLGIIGDHLFCRQAQGENPFRPVLAHIEVNPEGCKIEEVKL